MSIRSEEEFNKFVVSAKAKMAEVETQAERLQALERLVPQLEQQIADQRRAAMDTASNRPIGASDATVEQTYYRSEASRKELGGAVAQLGQSALDADKGKTYIGSAGGVVRMLASQHGSAYDYGLLDDPNPKSEWQAELQQRAEEIAWVRAFKREPSAELVKGFAHHLRSGPRGIAKVFADNAGEGGEWIVTIPLSMLERTAELPRTLEGRLTSMALPTMTVTHPFLTTGVQPFLRGIPVAGDNNPAILPKSVPTTAERTITAKTLTVNVPVDSDAEEDAIIAALPYMQRLVAEALADGTEDALINGDTAAPHQDTAFATWNPRGRWGTLGSSLDHRKSWIGFRARATDVSSTVDQNATQTAVGYMAQRAGMSSPHGLGSTVFVISPENYLAKLVTDSNFLTIDKVGPMATLLTGQVGVLGGAPVVLSEFITADLAATGLYTGTGALTGALWVNFDRFVMARRRSQRIQIETVIREHTVYIVASERKTLHTFDGSSVKNVRWLYNLASS